jgi:3-hydroxybutyryl-CoA dehydrogenase
MMGKGIAACLAAGGHAVRLFDVNADAVAKAVEDAADLRAFLQKEVFAGAPVGAIVGAATLAEAVDGADAVFEAVFEDMGVKQATFAQLAEITGDEVPLCSNTSSLSISEIARGVPDERARARVLAAHFIGPAHLVPLVEVCPAATTAAGFCEAVVDLLTGCGKKPILLQKECPGFLAARLQAALYRECMHLKLIGVADAATIDAAVVNGFGRRFNQIGPFQQCDFAGVDLVKKTHGLFFPILGTEQEDHLAKALVEEGKFGVKAGEGHYPWPPAQVKEVSSRRDGELLRRLKVDFKS